MNKSYTQFHAIFPMTICLVMAILSAPVRADFVVGPFGSNGQGGSINDQSLTFGTSGAVFELDGYLNIAGRDLNGTGLGTSRMLSQGPIPGLAYSFSNRLSADAKNLTLVYKFTNNSNSVFDDMKVFLFLDSEIDSSRSYTDEYGVVSGVPGSGANDSEPDSWEIDENGAVFGNIVLNLFNGVLQNENAITLNNPNDVSMALGFRLGTLSPGSEANVSIMLSENGEKIGSFALEHHDLALPGEVLTFSGQSVVTVVPEPSSFLLIGTGLVGLIGLGFVHSRQRR